MAELSPRDFPPDLQRLYARLSRQDIEEFYAGYQLWQARQRATALQTQIEVLRRQIAANAERMRLLQPSEQALAVLSTLRHYGVSDLELLDQLLERGEAWLVRMLADLEQCRRLGLFDGDYTRWCQHALEGAYDWLASIGEETPAQEEAALPPAREDALEPVLTEEEFLRRLVREETAPLPVPEPAPSERLAPASEETAPGVPAQAEVIPLPPEAAWQMGTADGSEQLTALTNGNRTATASPSQAEGVPSPMQSSERLHQDGEEGALPASASECYGEMSAELTALAASALQEQMARMLVTEPERAGDKEGAEVEERAEPSTTGESSMVGTQDGELYEFSAAPSAETPLPGAGEQVAPSTLGEEAGSVPPAVPLPTGADSFSPAAQADAASTDVAAVEESGLVGPTASAEPGQETAEAKTVEMTEAVPAGEEERQAEDPSSAATMQNSPLDEAEALPPSRESEATGKLHPWRRFFGRRSAD